jgi:hypothetical protein
MLYFRLLKDTGIKLYGIIGNVLATVDAVRLLQVTLSPLLGIFHQVLLL